MDISVDGARLCGRHQGARHPWRLRRNNRCLRRFWPRTRSKITKVNYPMQYTALGSPEGLQLGRYAKTQEANRPTDRPRLVGQNGRSIHNERYNWLCATVGLGWVPATATATCNCMSCDGWAGYDFFGGALAGTPRRPIC